MVKRMVACRNWDQDPIVWSNDRFFLFLKKHNFEAEAKNLNGLGIHGALLVLSKSFTIERLFDKMKLNNSKQFVRARNNLYKKLNDLLSGPRYSHLVTATLVIQYCWIQWRIFLCRKKII